MKQLDPKSIWLFFMSSMIAWGLFLVFLCLLAFGLFAPTRPDLTLYQLLSTGLRWLLIIIPIITITSFLTSKLHYHYYRYELKDDSLRIESGIIWKKYVSIAYDRIQNVDIHRSLIARLLKLSTLSIQTAGSSAQRIPLSEGVLPGLPHDIAIQIRDDLIKRAQQYRGSFQGL